MAASLTRALTIHNVLVALREKAHQLVFQHNELSEGAKEKILDVLEEERKRWSPELESLPILEGAVRTPKGMWMGFILGDDGWWPVAAMNPTLHGWVEYRVDLSNEDTESGVAMPFKWASCTADNLPCLPTFKELFQVEDAK